MTEITTDTVIADRKFAIVDEWVINLPISDRALRLYVLLTRYADNYTHRAWPSRETLATRLDTSKASVDRAINELVKYGAISKQQRHNNSLVFTVHITKPSVITGDEPVVMDDEAIVTGDERVSSRVMTGVVMGDDLTIPIELEPENYSARAKQMPKDYRPDDSFAEKFPDLNIEEEFEAFCDHHLANGSTFKDWDRAFSSWCRKSKKFAEPKTVIHKQALKPATNHPGHRDWVELEHNRGDHWACRGGEFGHPVDWRYGS